MDDARRRAVLARRWAAASAHRERLLRLARPRVPSEQDAEDCVQEAILRCVEFPDLDEDRLGPFLTTVTVRLCADQYRRHAHGERLRRRLAAWSDDDPGHEEEVCDRAEAAWLAGTVAALPERQREVVTARAEGMSCGAVAATLRLSYTTVESALARARRSVRTALESSLGVVAQPVLRLRLRGLAGVGVVTAVGAGLAPVPALPDRTPSSAPPAAIAPVTPRQPAATPHVAPPRPAPATAATAVRAVPLFRVVKPPALPIDLPVEDPPMFSSESNVLTVEDEAHDYTIAQRYYHCLKYGISRRDICEMPPEEEHPGE